MLVYYKKHCIDLIQIFMRILKQYILIYHRWLQKQIRILFTKENGNAKSLCQAQLLFQGFFAFTLPADKMSKSDRR